MKQAYQPLDQPLVVSGRCIKESSKTGNSHGNSLFGRLPAKLRPHVFELALNYEESLLVTPRGDFAIIKLPHRECNVLALAGTCRQVREECHPLFYSLNTSTFGDTTIFHKLSNAIGELGVNKSLRKLVLIGGDENVGDIYS